MPDKPLQVAAYAAGASLAAVTLVYVFGPTFFLDDDAAQSTRSSRKRGVVGLSNPANDCFINSVLQCLAGLPELRAFVAREVHLRRLGGDVWNLVEQSEDEDEGKEKAGEGAEQRRREGEKQEEENVVAPFDERGRKAKSEIAEWKKRTLQQGLVTIALKEVLDALNERPIYKKTLSAQAFVTQLEAAFRTRINRTQQDAQEFLQLVTERLCDEYHAGRRARRRAIRRARANGQDMKARRLQEAGSGGRSPPLDEKEAAKAADSAQLSKAEDERDRRKEDEEKEEDERGFPFEGKTESQIECTYCHFKPRPSTSSFVTLTLHVPQGGNNTSLSTCFDNILKLEHIDDFICAKCRIQHALDTRLTELARASATSQNRSQLKNDIELLRKCLAEDPESPPKDVTLPDSSLAPRRKIARHSSIAEYPSILAIHLSRSMWAADTSSTKNQVKVSFPESLPLGGILHQVKYKLLGVVTHKGGHNSGHYESFRRQVLREPYSTPADGWGGKAGLFNSVGLSSSPRPSGASASGANSSAKTAAVTPGAEPVNGSTRPNVDPTESSTSITTTTSHPSRLSGSTSTTNDETRTSSPATETGTTASLDTASAPGSPAPQRTNGPAEKPLKSKSSMARVGELVRLGSGSGKGADSGGEVAKKERTKKKVDKGRWWRISDDKIKECGTRDVLKMEREVYLLFYELVPPGEG